MRASEFSGLTPRPSGFVLSFKMLSILEVDVLRAWVTDYGADGVPGGLGATPVIFDLLSIIFSFIFFISKF